MRLSLPPDEYMRLVCGDKPSYREEFDRVGGRIARGLASVKMLEPGARLLDIGCGCGRIARHLLDSPITAYRGFDRHAGMIEWAQANIGAVDERFEFLNVDVRSGYEELDSQPGTVGAAEFVFPYDDGEFTGALAASVFTHIDFPATSRYLSETARVLRPGGAALGTVFLGDATGPMGRSGWNFLIREDDLQGATERAGLEVLLFSPARPPSRQSWVLLGKPGARTGRRGP